MYLSEKYPPRGEMMATKNTYLFLVYLMTEW
jgi:hypothetical protein